MAEETTSKPLDKAYIDHIIECYLQIHGRRWSRLDRLILRQKPQKSTIDPTYTSYINSHGKRVGLRTVRYLGKHLQFRDDTPWYLSEDNLNTLAEHILNGTRPVKVKIAQGDGLARKYVTHYGASSCMTGTDRERRLWLYRLNPDKIKLFTVERGRQQARALLWHFDDGTKAIDRAFGTTGQLCDTLKREAQRLGYWNVYHGEDNKGREICDGSGLVITGLRNNWRSGKIAELPYLDTLHCSGKWFDKDKQEVLTTLHYYGSEDIPQKYRKSTSVYPCTGGNPDCRHSYSSNKVNDYMTHYDGLGFICKTCLAKLDLVKCDWCKQGQPKKLIKTIDKLYVCGACLCRYYYRCQRCSKQDLRKNTGIDGYCRECHKSKYKGTVLPRPRRLRGANNG